MSLHLMFTLRAHALRGVGKGTAPPLPLWRSQQSAAGKRLGKEREGRGGSRTYHQHQPCWICLLTRSRTTNAYSSSLCASHSCKPLSLGTNLSPASLPLLLFPNSSGFHGVWWQLAELSGIAAFLEETWSEPRGLVGGVGSGHLYGKPG